MDRAGLLPALEARDRASNASCHLWLVGVAAAFELGADAIASPHELDSGPGAVTSEPRVQPLCFADP